jgi:hypothetical protein
MKIIVWTILLLINITYASEINKVINLHYTNTKKVITLIQPLLGPQDKVTGEDKTLVVSVTPKTMSLIRQVIKQVDVPPTVFKVSVFQGNPSSLDAITQTNGIYITTNSQDNRPRLQEVTVNNGQTAVVDTSSEVPVLQSVAIGWTTGVNYQRVPINQGFMILPILQGNKVQLSIRKIQSRISPNNQNQNDSQTIETTLTVPMNKWVNIGSSENNIPTQNNAWSYSTGNRYSLSATVFIKIDVVH